MANNSSRTYNSMYLFKHKISVAHNPQPESALYSDSSTILYLLTILYCNELYCINSRHIITIIQLIPYSTTNKSLWEQRNCTCRSIAFIVKIWAHLSTASRSYDRQTNKTLINFKIFKILYR